jgi:hypothetical protein
MVCDHAKRVERGRAEAITREQPKHTKYLAVVDEGLAAETNDAFAFRPLRAGDPARIFPRIFDPDGFGGSRNASDLALANRDATELTTQARPVCSRVVNRFPGARDQVKAGNLGWTIGSHGTGLAAVAIPDQPDSCERGSRLPHQPANDRREQRSEFLFSREGEQQAPRRIKVEVEFRSSHSNENTFQIRIKQRN